MKKMDSAKNSSQSGPSSTPGTELSTNKFKIGEKVELEVLRETDLGFVARIDSKHEGLLYHSEIFEKIAVGQRLPGYVRQIRPDGKIDLILQAFGNLGADEIATRILDVLRENQGFIAVTDKTPPEQIYNLFGVSKKKFKIALGGLYKKRMIQITDSGVRLLK